MIFRFDIDTLTCVEKGLPPLLDLAKKYGLQWDFYLNVGKSIDRGLLLERRRRQQQKVGAQGAAAKVSIRRKLGAKNLLRTLVLNPTLISSKKARRNLERLQRDGHRLGLHGGINHGTWLYAIHSMSQAELDAHFDPAYERFSKLFGKPTDFAAPGFLTNEMVKRKLKAKGFVSHGDDWGSQKQSYTDDQGLIVKPVTIIGQGTVPILEQGWASGSSKANILQSVQEEMRRNDYQLLYGHPCFEGLEGLPLLAEVVEQVVYK